MPPLPPADLAGRSPRTLPLAAGTIVHRFYSAAHNPIFYDRSRLGRLNAPDGSYGVLYAAAAPHGAFAETFLRSPGLTQLDPKLLARKAYARLAVARKLKFILLAGPGLAVVGATAEVVHGGLPYDAAQNWSKTLHAHPIAADGIAYNARHDDQELCFAIFDRAAVAITEFERKTDLTENWFWDLAEHYGMGSPP
jgi:hypothetical protein